MDSLGIRFRSSANSWIIRELWQGKKVVLLDWLLKTEENNISYGQLKILAQDRSSRGVESPDQRVNWPPKILDWGEKIDTSLMWNRWFLTLTPCWKMVLALLREIKMVSVKTETCHMGRILHVPQQQGVDQILLISHFSFLPDHGTQRRSTKVPLYHAYAR